MSSSPKIPDTNKILVILGPTSSGKSDIAIKLAKKFDGEIISADSRQIFRGMDIGTGKIERDPRLDLGIDPKVQPWVSHSIPHYMINIISPRTNYNVTKFKKQAEKIIEDILKRKKFPIICGGTGFWIQAIVDDVNFPEVNPDWKLRSKLEKYSAEKLFTMLKKLDPLRAKTIDQKNAVRLIRAIEICRAIGKVPSPYPPSLDKGGNKRGGRNTKYTFLQIGLKSSQEKLHANIKKRLEQRFNQGMIAEVKKLHAQDLSWNKIQSFGLGYFWIPLYLQKIVESEDELFEKIFQAEKNYAKRQMTWFRRDRRIKWVENYKEIEKSTKYFLK